MLVLYSAYSYYCILEGMWFFSAVELGATGIGGGFLLKISNGLGIDEER